MPLRLDVISQSHTRYVLFFVMSLCEINVFVYRKSWLQRKHKELPSWTLVKKFANRDEAELTMKTEWTWSLHYYHKTKDGNKKILQMQQAKKTWQAMLCKNVLIIRKNFGFYTYAQG